MADWLARVARELGETARRPQRLGKLFSREAWRRRRARQEVLSLGELPWRRVNDGEALKARSYGSYEQYLEHQRGKLSLLDLSGYDRDYYEVLRARLGQLDWDWNRCRVLCLAARIGTEVRSFISHGAFAVGIDLNPGADNKYVVTGDFHDLQYAPGSVDVVFSNSLDHAYQIEQVLSEVRRVLAPTGHLIIEAMHGSEEGHEPKSFEALWWKSIDDLVAVFQREGFLLQSRHSFEQPWPGEQLVLACQAVAVGAAPPGDVPSDHLITGAPAADGASQHDPE